MQYNPKIHKLNNGVTVILDPMDWATTTVKVYFATGGRDEKPDELGLTHFCEHMLCKGTSRFPNQRDRKEFLEYNGAQTNAATGITSVAFFGRVIAENLKVLIEVLGDQLQNSVFDPNKIEIERNVVLDEFRRTMDDPKRQLVDFTSGKLFNYRTFSNRIFGTAETIASFSRDQIIEFLGRRLSAHNCTICISGKINDMDDVLQCLERTFAFLPVHDVTGNSEIVYTPAIAHNLKSDKENVKLRILFPNLWPSTYEYRMQNMAVGKFERHMIREITEVVRHKNGLVYGFHGDGVGNENFELSGFGTETSVKDVAHVIELIAQTAARIYFDQTITDQDLVRYNCIDKLADADWLESPGRRCDSLLNYWRLHNRIYDFYDTVKISESITRDDVIKYSRGYFDGPMSIITQGPAFDSDLKKIWDENFCQK